jgi:hypothetical protein
MDWRKLFSGPRPAQTPEDVIRFYRELGFFRDGSFEDVARRLLERFESDYDRPFNPNEPWDDLWLLSYDEGRVWHGDPECDVCPGNQVYEEVLEEWSRVSDGCFVPESIEETWEGEEGPISVRFLLNGKQYVLHPKWHYDWLDLEVLGAINSFIEETGRQFVCASDVNFAVVFALDAGTKRLLSERRKLPFIDLP